MGDLVVSAGQNARVLSAAAGATLAFAGTVVVGGGGSLAVANLALSLQAFNTAVLGLSGVGSRLALEAVTVPEHPEWGALTGTLTAAADGEGRTSTGNIPNPLFFIVVSGPCTTAVVDGHSCVGRWPGGYGVNEHCDILVVGGGGGAAGGALGPCPVFDISTVTGYGGDALALPGGTEYNGANCPAGAPLAVGDALTWTSDWAAQGNIPASDIAMHSEYVVALGGNVGLPRNMHYGAGGGWQICFA
eukprot:SAG11_NODE_55_length_19449_cov_28.630135_6_plen_246_part_00